MQVNPVGIVAAGHPATADAAAQILEAGGNAFDAVIAGQFAACVAEPVLCSLGGGGFLLARPRAGPVQALDFFVQTPMRKRPVDEIEFLPIVADFGDAQQEFHIGLGSVATPGMVRGLFAAWRRLASLPMSVLVEPAVQLAREGVRVNALQAHAFRIVGAIYRHSEASRALFASPTRAGSLVVEGDRLQQTAFADVLERLACDDGEAWFYTGEFAHQVVDLCRGGGGHLELDDLRGYRAPWREPLALEYRGHRIWTNPPPASGGLLSGFALRLLEASGPAPAAFGSADHLHRLARVMELTDRARLEAQTVDDTALDPAALLDPELLERYLRDIRGRPMAVRGTTHLSVIDAAGNVASLTASNGEGWRSADPGYRDHAEQHARRAGSEPGRVLPLARESAPDLDDGADGRATRRRARGRARLRRLEPDSYRDFAGAGESARLQHAAGRGRRCAAPAPRGGIAKRRGRIRRCAGPCAAARGLAPASGMGWTQPVLRRRARGGSGRGWPRWGRGYAPGRDRASGRMNALQYRS
ncbi:Gamma-glutamyltranspeptidase [Thioalkalivibrio nitratireducens DSM 14787]|uniref:Gamma-glutamyltranspeptidase n=1 Tax=Thioalkalivibrio nitratireducens (strain DSM 14787 / UNIQEM 213 / ALEN2) TaxID=1255043 RepID=L0DVD6_THIND|nr:Gamma-glutamyltranspeptidase [Thioalkalivibrio nitratireducens DSM 14787]